MTEEEQEDLRRGLRIEMKLGAAAIRARQEEMDRLDPEDKVFLLRKAGERLLELGGSEPNFPNIPRRRSPNFLNEWALETRGEEAMPLILDENAPRPSRAVMEKAFEIAEASLWLEGMKPGPRYYALKARVLAGEITTDQAVAEMTKPPVEPVTLDKLKQENREVLNSLAGVTPAADPEIEEDLNIARKVMHKKSESA